MENFPGNSNTPPKPDEPEKKIDKVTTGRVIQRKKPLSRRFAETFIAEDAKGVGHYIITEVLIPAAKDLIAEMVSQGIERTLFGGGRSSGRTIGRRPISSNGYVSYNRYSSQQSSVRQQEERRDISRRARVRHEFDEIVLATRVEADEVIDRMYDLLSRYEQVTVSDLYELIGVESKFTDEKWGWRKLDGARSVRVTGGGYLLDLPKPEQLD